MKRDFKMPKCAEIDRSNLTDSYGKFIVQPLERGFGTTLGNALRRVLLSSIDGAAIQSIKIDGVHHEFSTIPGVVEDVSEIVLNLKEVCVRLHGDGPRTIVVEKHGRAEWVAGDLEVDPRVEILNSEHHIATLDEGGHIRAAITITKGWGYVPWEENRLADQPVDTIVLDSVFSPVRKVNYKTENTRVGQRTDYEKLTLEVWTNRTVRPEDAVARAAKLLKDHLDLFITFEKAPAEPEVEKVDQEEDRLRKLLETPVDELELSVRSSNCLDAAGIKTLGELVQKTESEMLKYRNFGRKSLSELQNVLAKYGLHFGMDVSKVGGKSLKEKTDAASEEGA